MDEKFFSKSTWLTIVAALVYTGIATVLGVVIMNIVKF
ncbi:hypothetical protein LFAB_13465 [Lactiplantibacillus fabifermentans T30PCM01]|uniref:Uncharacterized protein n=1 Tax=Lactiplantibacillus fabifermentans T30PCM01 TaxID=1400520 RepID=W6T5J4_9LACO|nr:hypothetical protein LFAB_13465 [Lactiplantibacillus fabifermentans T30PCM01]